MTIPGTRGALPPSAFGLTPRSFSGKMKGQGRRTRQETGT